MAAPESAAAAPFFSVVVPLYNTAHPLLAEMIDSVREQTFTDWELVLVDDASPDRTTPLRAEELAASDPRIRVTPLEVNRGIAEATNVGLGLARGTFIALLDHDDVLAPAALEHVHAAISAGTDVDYVYTDEDKIDEDGKHYETFAKPDWSPERLLGQMYTSHLSVFRRSLLEGMAHFDTRYNGSQDHELILRITERARSIVHVTRTLYHWRAIEGSTAKASSAKSYAWDAGVAALEDTLHRRGTDGKAMRGPAAGIYYVRRNPVPAEAVTTVITHTAGAGTDAIPTLLADLKRSPYGKHGRILIVASRKEAGAISALLNRGDQRRVEIVIADEAAHANDRRTTGILAARTEFVLLIDSTAHLGDVNVPAEILMPLVEDDVAMCGGRLLDAKGKVILHAGYRYAWGSTRHPYRGAPKETLGRIGALLVNREVSAVCTSLAAVRREAFLAVGGFSRSLSGTGAEIDLGWKLRAAGGRVLTVSRAEAKFPDLGETDADVTPADRETLTARWGRPGRDPYTA